MAYMCNTSNIKEMKNGRPQTVMFEGVAGTTHPNGKIVDLGIPMVWDVANPGRDYDHVRKATVPVGDVTAVAGKWIVVAPEINIEEYRLIDGQISKFTLDVNTTYPAYQLQLLDRIEYSESYFDNNGADIIVGDYVKINAQGVFEEVAGGNAGNSAFRVVAKTPMFYPVILGKNAPIGAPGQAGNPATFLPTSGYKFKLEVIA